MSIHIVRGTTQKPASSGELIKLLVQVPSLSGQLFVGYPIIGTATGPHHVDALFISQEMGIVIFDLIEGTGIGQYKERQDDSFNKLHSRLRVYPSLMNRRELRVPIQTISFSPEAINPDISGDSYFLTNRYTVVDVLNRLDRTVLEDSVYRETLSAIESISTIRQNRARRTIKEPDSLGARLKKLEESIATLDPRQSEAVIETVDGVQRIRGLAGSGKTIVLALKATYLHTQHPDWRIAVTFNTRSLKGFFQRLITIFSLEMTGEEPDWENLRVVNAWGASGGSERDGIYREFCRAHEVRFLDFGAARQMYGFSDAFRGACRLAEKQMKKNRARYDAILIDEAQDFSPSFLRICLSLLREPKRLVYAYDELQSLSGETLPSPEEIFGDSPWWTDDEYGETPRRDIILEKCYRNSRPVLVTAHALGFGIYRERPEGSDTGLIQMFDNPELWKDVGYKTKASMGVLEEGSKVSLERTEDTSPSFLEDHSSTDELVEFLEFASEEEQAEWLAAAIRNNLTEDELRHDDILIINPDPRTTREKVGLARRLLMDMGIDSHLAGVDTDSETFFSDHESVTFTGVYRAKGNEAGMVYVINAQDCDSLGRNLASLRNQLFTAITRSKAWIRVLGFGRRMEALIAEFERLQKADFVLNFTYPSADQREQLRIVHRDMPESDPKRLGGSQQKLFQLLSDLESGYVHTEDLDPDAMARLRKIIGEE